MADNNPDWDLGEFRGTADCVEVEYDEDSISAGDFLQITGFNDDGQPKVKKQTAATNARFVATYDGDDGDIRQVLRRGVVKVTFGIATALGAQIQVKGNKAVTEGTGSSGNRIGYSLTKAIAADDDTGIIFFDGSAT